MKRPVAMLTAFFFLAALWVPVLGVFAENADDGSIEPPRTTAASAATTFGALYDGLQDEDTVADYTQLKEWLDKNGGSGKVVTFSDTITVPADSATLKLRNVTVNTLHHGFVIEGMVWTFGAYITGAGGDAVVTVESGGSLEGRDMLSEIAATDGGCAVQIKSGGVFETRLGWYMVRAEGAGAVGIDAETGFALSDTAVISDGIGIKAGGDVELRLCDIDAPIPIETGGAVVLDTCVVSGTVKNATTINRKITGISPAENLSAIFMLGETVPDDWFYNSLNVLLDDDGDIERDIPVSWDMSGIDANAAGEYEVACTILAPYDRFGLDSEAPISATVTIVDASFPALYETYAVAGAYKLQFLYVADDLSGLTVWRSDDDGANWYDYTQDAGLSFSDTLWLIFGETPEHPVLLVFEVAGLGESKILRLTWDNRQVYPQIGGDRNSLDRGGEEQLPSNPNPAPEPERESGYTSARSSRTWSGDAVQTAAEIAPPDAPPVETAVKAETADAAASGDGDGQATATAPPIEWENDTATAVSGKRLRMMMDAGSKVTFIKQDVRLSFAPSVLDALNIGDDQLFTVTVTHLEQLQYAMVVTLDGIELENLPCVVTFDGNSHETVVSGTYDFAQTADEREVPQADGTADEASPLEPTGGDADGHAQSTEKNSSAQKRLAVAALGTAGVAVAAALTIRGKRHGR